MSRDVYRYSFTHSVPLDEVETTLLLAIWGAEALHGESRVRLDTAHLLDRGKRVCVIDVSSEAGRDFNSLFVGYLAREFGPDAFRVEPDRSKHETVPI